MAVQIMQPPLPAWRRKKIFSVDFLRSCQYSASGYLVYPDLTYFHQRKLSFLIFCFLFKKGFFFNSSIRDRISSENFGLLLDEQKHCIFVWFYVKRCNYYNCNSFYSCFRSITKFWVGTIMLYFLSIIVSWFVTQVYYTRRTFE